jgi:hypothetical protein
MTKLYSASHPSGKQHQHDCVGPFLGVQLSEGGVLSFLVLHKNSLVYLFHPGKTRPQSRAESSSKGG